MLRHQGRDRQRRFFISESDRKAPPMAAVIAAMAGMIIPEDFVVNHGRRAENAGSQEE